MKEIYFHEDDYCQIELAPVENEEFIKQEIDAISNFSEQHKAPNGIGWTKMYMRKEPQCTLKEKGIHIKEFDDRVGKVIGKYDEVYTGYSTYKEKCRNTNGYGDDTVRVFIEYNEEVITHIWFDFLLNDDKTAKRLYEILNKITDNYDLLFVHWPWGFYSRPKNDIELLNKLKSASNELRNRMEELNTKKPNIKKWWEIWK